MLIVSHDWAFMQSRKKMQEEWITRGLVSFFLTWVDFWMCLVIVYSLWNDPDSFQSKILISGKYWEILRNVFGYLKRRSMFILPFHSFAFSNNNLTLHVSFVGFFCQRNRPHQLQHFLVQFVGLEWAVIGGSHWTLSTDCQRCHRLPMIETISLIIYMWHYYYVHL